MSFLNPPSKLTLLSFLKHRRRSPLLLHRWLQPGRKQRIDQVNFSYTKSFFWHNIRFWPNIRWIWRKRIPWNKLLYQEKINVSLSQLLLTFKFRIYSFPHHKNCCFGLYFLSLLQHREQELPFTLPASKKQPTQGKSCYLKKQ